MKKALLFLLLLTTALQLRAAVGHGYIVVCWQESKTDSIAVHGTFDITHSMLDLEGVEHDDYVTMVVTTAEGEWRYPIDEVQQVVLPVMRPWERITLTGDINLLTGGNDSRKRIVFDGTFPKKDGSVIKFKWQEDDPVWIHMADQEVFYKVEMDKMTADSTFALFKPVEVEKKEMPLYVYYNGNDPKDTIYNQVNITRYQTQTKVNNTEHIGRSGDCATSPTTLAPINVDPVFSNFAEDNGKNIYTFQLQHHPVFFTFLTHNPRLPSVKVKSVTMVADKPISGTFNFDHNNGINLTPLKDGNDSITLYTPYFYDDGWKHTPRLLENSQDSTAAYMVVAPQKGDGDGYLNFKFIFNVEDTLSRIDTTFVKKFKIKQLKPNTFYTIDAEVPDTLFSIVDMGIGDIKFAFRNVESYFERSKISNYGGAMAYGEANTKNSYEGGTLRSNWAGGVINEEFVNKYDAAYQRWRGCWRLPQLSEIDTLFKYCTKEYGGKIEWTEYNGVEGALFTGPSGKRIFLPASDLSSNYWATNREWTEDSLWSDHSDGYGSWWTTYHDINVLELDKNRTPVAYWGQKKMHDPGYVRGVLEYSNDIRSNTGYDGSLILLRHLGEYEEDKKNFAITGLVRSVRPWPTVGTNPYLNETGFIFGTDSATLYFDEGAPEYNKTWVAADSMFAKNPKWLPMYADSTKHYNHLKLIDGQKSPSAYGGTPDNPNETKIKVVLSGEQFLGYLDKHQKYYVREYFMIPNPVTKKNDYYYASKATPIEGFFPHTDKIRWRVGETNATFNAHVVGVSTEVVGHVGFILSDSIIVGENDNNVDYALPTLSTGKLYLSDEENEQHELGGLNSDMTYSLTIGEGSKQNIPFENKYYFARAVFVTISEDPISHKRDTTCYYAPDDEVFIVHPLDTIDLGLPSGTLWANLCIDAQYPEDRDGSKYQWNTGPALNPLISDISGTAHDETFRDWFGREGWTFAMPSKAQMDELMENCTFDPVTRFGRSVYRIAGPNSREVNGVGNVLYIPSVPGCEWGSWHSAAWTSTRPMKDYVNAYWGMCKNKSYHGKYLTSMESSLHIRPLQQTIGETRAAGELIFVSTDTIGNNQKEPEKISFWGRELGVTQTMKTRCDSIIRGFLVDEVKFFEFKKDEAHPQPIINLPDTTQKDNIFNGLYSVHFPVEDIERIDADKEYWYRAYICVNGEYFYGVPKLLPTTEIHMKHRDWEVHGKQATLYSQLDGMVYVKNKLTAKTGFIVGKTPDVDLEHYDTLVYANDACYGRDGDNNRRIQDGIYSQVIRVAKDTIYWVRAFLEADYKTRLSEARQFGLDYVDLGITDSKGHKMLWANLCVGSGYPEDSCEYYSPGEAFVKAQATDHAHYADSCYIDDMILKKWWPSVRDGSQYQTTDSVILKQLQVPNQQNTKTYSVPYRGARRDTYGSCNSNTGQWIHYSGTKNDAAFVNWGYQNPKFNDATVYNQNTYQGDNTGYGNLFVEPNYDEWQKILSECRWEEYLEDDVNGWLVTGPNGNSIFLPNRGYRTSNITGVSDGKLTWEEHWYSNLDGGSFHIADTTFLVQRSRTGVYYSSGDYRNGHLVRPIARYNLPLTKSHTKLRDDTLAYLATDTVTYMHERTAVALRGDFRINWPMASNQYRLGFIIGDNANVMIDDPNSINATNIVRNGSQYFVVLDKYNNLIGDKTYYYRFYLEILDKNLPFYNVGDENSNQHVYYAAADTFHLGRMKTGDVDYQIYGTQATMYGHVQGIMPGEVEGQNAVQAGILLSYDRNKLTVDEPLIANGGKLIGNYDCSEQLIASGNAGQYNGAFHKTYFIPVDAPDTTYYFRAYATYNGKTHYGDINVWGYEMVDLGLPSGKKWASINVGGANSLLGKSYGYIGGERHGVGENNDPDLVYRTSGPGGINDPAHLQWVNVSRMSRKDEMEELINECDWIPDTIHNVPGVTARSKTNGRSIFFRNIVYRDGVTKSNTHYTTQSDYMHIYESNDAEHYKKPGFPYYEPLYGCYKQTLLRPIWESNIHLDNANKDELLIRTDDAIIHTPRMDKVTFFGSLLGVTQRRRGDNNYQVEGLHHAGFIIGVDTLVAHKNDVTNENKIYFKYDFPKNNTVTTDSIYYYETANINFFKVDTAYWVRAYVQIGDQYFYGRSIKFVRQPNITTGDVEWKVGQQKATLHGSVVGFNSDVNLKPQGDNVDPELIDIDEVAKNAKVGILVGYKHDLTHESPASERDSSYVLASLTSGNTDFSVTVDYKKDTTYYYRAFIYYNGQYRYGMTGRFGLEFVDLGLPMHWASINVGSRFAEDHSDKFSWGDTETQNTYRFNDYRYYYATGDDEYNNLGNEIKGTQHDVAHKKWDYTWDEAEYGGRGQLWAMPSEEDLQMLVDSCEWSDSTSYAFNPTRQTYDEVKGFKVYSKKTGRSIFINSLETAEWDIKGNHNPRGSNYAGPFDYGPLWTSSRAPRERNAYGMEVGAPDNMKAKHLMKYHYRYHGHYVRPMAYLNVELPDHDHKKLSITTERTSWVAGDESATIYGCVLGLTDEVKGSFGFVVGNTNDKNQLKVGGSGMEQKYEVKANSSQNGIFSYNITPLDNHRMYYYRAYLKIGDKYYYDDQINDFGIIEVDLGLTSGTRWANVNMGAWKPKDHGEFYGWGETSTKDVFTYGGYKFYDGVNNTIRELSTNISGNDTTDVAAKTLGGLWRMAGDEEWNELRTQCTWTKDTVSHIPGYRVTGTNGNSIFLPNNYYDPDNRDANYELETREDGYKNHDYEETKYGYYWSSNRASDYTKAREMQFSTEPDVVAIRVTDNARYRGNAIRAVIHPNCGENNKFYLRTEDTDWRYEKDSVNFYAVALAQESLSWGNWYEDSRDYEVGIVIGESPNVTLQANGTASKPDTMIIAKPSKLGGGDFVATLKPFNLDHNKVYYYSAWLIDHKDGDKVYNAPTYKQFGFQGVGMGNNLSWANINVDAASPEQIGLNGVPTGKYAGVDPAFAEFGSIWRVPTDAEKQALLDERQYTWTNVENDEPIKIYGVEMWKVYKTDTPANFIYLLSKDPSKWGVRAVSQYNIQVDDKTAYLRTDSTNWRAGYSDNNLYASLVGEASLLSSITERGFVLTKTNGEKPATTDVPTDRVKFDNSFTASQGQVSASNFFVDMPALPVGTYYYRAYVKIGESYYYADEAKPVGIDFIDLGLSSGVKWANVNIGATVSSDTGDRYAWGETSVKSTFTQANYKYYNSVTKYKDIGADFSGNNTYDAASKLIEGTRMPTQSELNELLTECNWKKDTVNSVPGYRVTSTKAGNTNSIFLPYDRYWTSTQRASDNGYAISLFEESNNNRHEQREDVPRYQGLMIRPVSASITTLDATYVDRTTATINGVCSVPTDNRSAVGFEWTASSNPTNSDWHDAAATFASGNVGTMSANLAELTEGNIYYFRAFVQMSGESTRKYGTTKYFTTKSMPLDSLKAIEMGMSNGVKWGDRNVGATLPELDGEYYAWGDTLTRLNYNKNIYTHFDRSNSVYKSISNNFSASVNDIATRMFEGCWRMPTAAEIQELIDKCNWTWATKEGVPGYWVESKTVDHLKIFLPAAGYKESIDLKNNDINGYYWSATMTGVPTGANAQSLLFSSNSKGVGQGSGHGERYYGFSIRPVYQSNATIGTGDDKQDVFIRTDSIVYKADRTENKLYGTMLGLEAEQTDLKQGFVIGNTTDVDKDNKSIIKEQTATANGTYFMSLSNEDLKSLLVGEIYYVRAFVAKDGEYRYGNYMEMKDYTFFTDSVKWSLGNSGTLYAHVKAQKSNNLEVGFVYSTDNSEMENGRLKYGKLKTATFERDSIFKAIIDTIRVHTYFYQAYTLYDGTYHYGEVKSFGAKLVDLGLPSGIKWVDMNLGADTVDVDTRNNPRVMGDHYRWGDVAPNQTESSTVPIDVTYIGGTEYDAALRRLGSTYRLPSIDNFNELLTECEWSWQVNGYLFTSKHNSNTIFLPLGHYWTSLRGDDNTKAIEFDCETSNTHLTKEELRRVALMLRPIQNPHPDMQGQGGNAGGGVIGGGGGGDVNE